MAAAGATDGSKLLLLPITLLLIPLLLPPTAQAQQSSTPSPTYGFSARFNPTVAVVVVLLISAFFFAGFLFVYCRQRASQRRDGSLRRAAAVAARSRRAAAVDSATRGLDPEVVKGFPTVVYADVKGHRLGDHADAPLECAVCLCEFDDEEALTLLPKCSHAFHPECIAEWLKSHTTCPVCRANLAADEEQGGAGEAGEECEPTAAAAAGEPSSSAVSSTAGNQEESRHPRPDDPVAVAIPVDGEEEDKYPEALTRMGSSRKGVHPPPPWKSLRTWRSRSARPAVGERVGQFWAEEDRERFTLRLPEDVRLEVMAGKLNRSTSVTGGFPAGAGMRSSRRGYIGGEGSSRGGRSYRMGLGRWDRKAKSDRGWAALGRAVAGMGSRHGGASIGGGQGELVGAGAAAAPAPSSDYSNDVSIKVAGEAAGEGSGTNKGNQVLAAVRDQFNCLIRGGSKHQQASSGEDDDEASTAALNKV